jgi:putative transposase
MIKYNPKIHNRRSIRLKGYDYSKAGLYFITICVQDRKHLFGEVIDGEMVLNEYGEIAYNEWKETEKIRKNCILHDFIIMPNHIHGIIEISFQEKSSQGNEDIGKFKSPSQTIGSFIRGYKITTIKKIKDKILNGRGGCTGELQFAPTAPMAPTKNIIKLNFKIWQRNYYEHIICNNHAFHNISKYINDNPKKWGENKSNRK